MKAKDVMTCTVVSITQGCYCAASRAPDAAASHQRAAGGGQRGALFWSACCRKATSCAAAKPTPSTAARAGSNFSWLGLHCWRLRAFARQQGLRGDDDRRGRPSTIATPLEDIVEADGAPPHQARAGAVRRPEWSASSRAPISCTRWSAWRARRSRPPTTMRPSASACWRKSRRTQWAPVATVNVVVHDGVVELWGVIIDERQRERAASRRRKHPRREGGEGSPGLDRADVRA